MFFIFERKGNDHVKRHSSESECKSQVSGPREASWHPAHVQCVVYLLSEQPQRCGVQPGSQKRTRFSAEWQSKAVREIFTTESYK